MLRDDQMVKCTYCGLIIEISESMQFGGRLVCQRCYSELVYQGFALQEEGCHEYS
jgi:formylmethanofuran dehydrogenase subunit E